MPYDPKLALKLGHFAQDSYDAYLMYANKVLKMPLREPGYEILNVLYANDRWDDFPDYVVYGFIARSTAAPNEVIVAIRGTEGATEWIDDGHFLPITCPFWPEAETEAGFTDLYKTLGIGPSDDDPRVKDVILGMDPAPQVVRITGHSLGGALATMLAGDLATVLAARGSTVVPQIYTFASPRVGDAMFARKYNNCALDSWRVDNTPDWVPNLPPLGSEYVHVDNAVPIDSTLKASGNPLCCHSLDTYMYMLSDGAEAMDAKCVYVPPLPDAFGPPGRRGGGGG